MKCGNTDSRNEAYKKKYTEKKFFNLLIPKTDPLIIDIGAHIGESVIFFSKIFPKAIIYSVEPDPESFTKLLRSVPDKTKAINVAIGSKNCTTTLFKYSKSHLNSLFRINKTSEDSLGYAKNSKTTSIKVKCITLDNLISELDIQFKKIHLLKIDAQGAELDILLGAQNMLKMVENITMEINFFDFYAKKSTFLDIENLLPGFELYAINKLSQNPKNFRTDWAEVFYRRINKII